MTDASVMDWFVDEKIVLEELVVRVYDVEDEWRVEEKCTSSTSYKSTKFLSFVEVTWRQRRENAYAMR